MSMQKQLFRIMWSRSRREASSTPNRRLLSQWRVNGFQGAGVAIPAILGTRETTTTTTTTATTTSNQSSNNNWIQGETLNLAADLRTFRPGDKLEIPYEMTISEGMQDFWQSVSYNIQSTVHAPQSSNSNNIACSLLLKPIRHFMHKIGFIPLAHGLEKWACKIVSCPFPWFSFLPVP
jgi:hypothetical protein